MQYEFLNVKTYMKLIIIVKQIICNFFFDSGIAWMSSSFTKIRQARLDLGRRGKIWRSVRSRLIPRSLPTKLQQ